MAEIVQLTDASERTLAALNGFVAELRREADSAGTLDELAHMVHAEDMVVFVAKEGEQLVGMGLLFIAQKLGKRIGFVEDIVIAEAERGKGLGKALMHAVIEEGSARHCTYLLLTSKPDKVAANGLYQALGFERKETNVYRLAL